MSKIKFDLNLQGLNELMKSEQMQEILSEKGAQVMQRANDSAQNPAAEYSMETKTVNWIAVTTVRANDGVAIRENLENNTLLKSLY